MTALMRAVRAIRRAFRSEDQSRKDLFAERFRRVPAAGWPDDSGLS